MPAHDGSWRPRPSVPPRPLGELAALLGLPAGHVPAGLAVTGVTLDSRLVGPGDLYAALPGSHVHGARFAAQARAAGAVAVLTDAAGAERVEAAGLPALVVPDARARLGEVSATVYGHPGTKLLVLGVTGTNGKTTTTYLLDAALRRAGHRTGLVGTVETRVGDDVQPSVRTTPEAPDVQALLALMVERGCTAVAMEVSSHALALGRVDGLVVDVAGFTNLSQDHLDFHGTIEDYYRAKADLFTPARSRRGVVVVDDAYGRRLADEAGVPVRTVSLAGGTAADWRADGLVHEPSGAVRLHATGPGADLDLVVGLPGDFNAANALLAVAMLHEAGVPLASVAQGLAQVRVPGRMERVREGQDFVVLVDYAHSPDAVARVLGAARTTARGRVLAVLGCGGDRDRGKRPAMGEVAARGADLVVVTDDNPRSEDPAAIRAAMLAGAAQVPAGERAEVLEVDDRADAIGLALQRAEPGDVVLVLGKGHEQGQEQAGGVRPFDDREVVRAVLQANGRTS